MESSSSPLLVFDRVGTYINLQGYSAHVYSEWARQDLSHILQDRYKYIITIYTSPKLFIA
jgi:hypothetical protein